KITVDARGEVLALKQTINTMVDQLSAFAAEVTRVAREVGTEGNLGGQANVEGVSGTWNDRNGDVNGKGASLTEQVRNIAQVTTAVATGDLSKKVTVDVRGEVLELKHTINTMVDQLGSFADEVTRVAREVGTEGKLGGQANVKGVSGTWKDLTDSVNGLASNLTGQVRNIADVTTAVAKGDLSQKITVDARGEGRGGRAEAERQPDDREPARDHRAQRRAGLAQLEPRALQRDDAGPARPADGLPADHVRADAPDRRGLRRVLPHARGRRGG